MDIQKELNKLAEDEQALRNRCGRKLGRFYNKCVTNLTCNDKVIEHATTANKEINSDLTQVIDAMKLIDYQV